MHSWKREKETFLNSLNSHDQGVFQKKNITQQNLMEIRELNQRTDIQSNVKVGLPHEADYLLEVPKDKTLNKGALFNKGTLYDMVLAFTEQDKANLIEGLQF